MAKRGRFEVIRDILTIVRDNKNNIRYTPLLRKANLSSSRFKEYYRDLLLKGFIVENISKQKSISLSRKGFDFIEKYQVIVSFVEEFDL
jgi:predicted transcriptional regulator